jgi:hypothetical protein
LLGGSTELPGRLLGPAVSGVLHGVVLDLFTRLLAPGERLSGWAQPICEPVDVGSAIGSADRADAVLTGRIVITLPGPAEWLTGQVADGYSRGQQFPMLPPTEQGCLLVTDNPNPPSQYYPRTRGLGKWVPIYAARHQPDYCCTAHLIHGTPRGRRPTMKLSGP